MKSLGSNPARASLLAIVLVQSCGNGSPTSPTAAKALVINIPSALAVGSSTNVITRVSNNGRLQAVAATLTADPPGIVAIDGLKITALAPAIATVVARYDGLEAKQTVAVVPDMSARWSGELSRTTCVRESGPASDPCRFGLNNATFRLVLTGEGADLNGTMEIPANEVNGEITGSVNSAGQSRMSGALQSGEVTITFAMWAGTVEGNEWKLEPLKWKRSFTNAFGPQVLVETWEVRQLTRQ
jgi:hypothetical protein